MRDYFDLNYSSIASDPKHRLSTTLSATTDKDTVDGYFDNPWTNASSIADTVQKFALKNSTIGKYIDYLQSLLTYNHVLYPVLGNRVYTMGNETRQDYMDVSYILDQYNIKFFAPYFVKEMLINGAVFLYKVQDRDGISYIRFPFSWCLVSGQENGVYRYMLDISKIKVDILNSLPSEIRKAYKDRRSGKNNTTRWYQNKYYILSSKAVAFTFDPNVLVNGGVAISPLAGLLSDSITLEKAKENVDIKDELDTIRLVHSKIPVDNKSGKPTLAVKTAVNFDNVLKKKLPSGVIPVSTPTDLTNIPLSGSGTMGAYDTVDKSLQHVFYGLGINPALFGSNTTSANIVKDSIKRDCNWLYTNLLPMLENYYNQELDEIKTKGHAKWRIKFIRQSYFSLKDDIATIKEQLSYGGSRMEYLAACGFTPLEIQSRLLFEQNIINIDNLMVVKPTSNTLSASDSQVGRPQTDEPTDDTDRLDG